MEPPPPTPNDEPVRLIPGPDVVEGVSLDEVVRRPLRVSLASDRTGTRIEGWTPGAMTDLSRPSTPMVRGAIELTPSGLIALGPDHPTTGGYPVIAVIRATSLDAFFARPIGSTVRFTPRA
jgi:allophanate hydrolase subunit 2